MSVYTLTYLIDDMDDFVVSDESDLESSKSKKRKRSSKPQASRKRSNLSPPVKSESAPAAKDDEEDIMMDEIPEGGSTAKQWNYDPDSKDRQPVTKPAGRSVSRDPKMKEKAHTKEPEDRYPWLSNLRDKEKRAPGDPEYDPRTIFIPPAAWNKFSPFEKQYWEIKQNLWTQLSSSKRVNFMSSTRMMPP